MKFTSLLTSGRPEFMGLGGPAREQAHAAEHFPRLVAQSQLNWWRAGELPSPVGVHIVVGAASYSLIDLELLDEINSRLSDGTPKTRIDVFDVTAQSVQEFREHVSVEGEVFQTPLAAVWIDGRLETIAQGGRARSVIVRYLESQV